MNRVDRDDMIVIGMSIDALLECVRQAETWSRAHGDRVGLLRTRQLDHAILTTRRKFFAEHSRSCTDRRTADWWISCEGAALGIGAVQSLLRPLLAKDFEKTS